MDRTKFIIAFILMFSACSADMETGSQNPVPPANAEPANSLSYLALGDSYTIGQNVSADQRWPVLLVKDLKAKGKIVKAPDIIAVTGWTTANLLSALKGKMPRNDYDIVSLLIGVNNQYQGLGLDQYRKEFRELLLKSIKYAGGRREKVFVLSTPDWGVTPYGSGSNLEITAKEIDSFNKVAREECEKLSIHYTDITPTSRLALNDKSMVASDGLHFSGKMHQLWVNLVIPHVTGIL